MWKFLIKIKVILITLPLLSTCCIISAQSKYLLSDLERKHISLEQYMKMSNKERYENKLPLENITEEMLDNYKKRQQGILPESTEPLSPSQEFVKKCEALVEKNPIVLGDHPYTPKFKGDFEDKCPRGSFGFNLASTYGFFYTLNGDYIAYEINGDDVDYYVTKAYKDGSEIHNFRVGRSQARSQKSNPRIGYFLDVMYNSKLELRDFSPYLHEKSWCVDKTGATVEYSYSTEEPVYLASSEAKTAWDLVEFLWEHTESMPASLNPDLDFTLYSYKKGVVSEVVPRKLADIRKKQADAQAQKEAKIRKDQEEMRKKLALEYKKKFENLYNTYEKSYADAVLHKKEFKIGAPRGLVLSAIDMGVYSRVGSYRLKTETANTLTYELLFFGVRGISIVGWIVFVDDKLSAITWL